MASRHSSRRGWIDPVTGQGATIEDFLKLDIRIGTVVRAADFPEARKPAIQLWIDFGGELGEKRSSAQITAHYTPESLVGKQVLAVVNFPPRQIGPMRSEVLTLGVSDGKGEIVLMAPDQVVPNGSRLS
ncbi:MAG: tRNA-binding protein [Maricaulis sp.]|jgi:tRNA-binding protein